MPNLRWQGPLLRGGQRDLLARAGWGVGGEDPRMAVVHTVRGEAPSAPTGPWLWLTDVRPKAGAVEAAMERGATDVVSMARAGWEQRLLARLTECLVEEPPLAAPPGFIADSAAAKALLRRVHQAAQTSMPVLMTGETGTGKELAARLVHQWSARRGSTFVPINCAAIPNELMEGELFGYAKGAFSGAVRNYDGLVSAAEGGTVFLDEIDDTPLALQVKLLRVLEDHVVSRLGESEWHRVDFRIIAATNRDLMPLIASGQFGADLYERLGTVLVTLPPLRDRLDDLPALTLQLIERYYAEEKVVRSGRVTQVTPEALELMRGYHWPGNVRELRNVVYGALVTKRAGDALLPSDLPRRLWVKTAADEGGVVSRVEVERRIASGKMNLREELERLERIALETALSRADGNAAEAARLLGTVGRGSARDPGGTVRTMMRRLRVASRT